MLQKIRRMLKNQEGFTLVELMIVVVILGIISGIGIQQYGRVQENARSTANDANIRIIKSAAQMWAMTTSGEITGDLLTSSTGNVDLLVTAGYLEAHPTDPWGTAGKVYELKYTVTTNTDGNEIIEIEAKHTSKP